ncbi:unnamed protein product [Choristocarpus tenellus]
MKREHRSRFTTQSLPLICIQSFRIFCIKVIMVSLSPGPDPVSAFPPMQSLNLPLISTMPTPADGEPFQLASTFTVDLKKEGFCSRNAYYLSHLSRVIYKSEEEVTARCSDLGLSEFCWFATKKVTDGEELEHDTQAFLASNDDFAVLIFRGSQEEGDLEKTNKEDGRVETQYGGVHEGFSGALDTVWGEIVSAIKEMLIKDPAKPIYLGGHSLGAALASIAAARLTLDENITINSIYTIGSPRRVGSRFA